MITINACGWVALGGLGEAFYFPAMSLISDYRSTRSRAMSLHQSGVYVGSIAGGALAGLIGQYLWLAAGLCLFGATGIVVGLLLWAFVSEPPRGMSDEGAGDLRTGGQLIEGLREIAGNPVAWLLIVVFMGAGFSGNDIHRLDTDVSVPQIS